MLPELYIYDMTKLFGLLLPLAVFALSLGSCRKCYTCKNECRFCYEQQADTILRQSFCSSDYTFRYYEEFTDSLLVLGWVCNDTNYTDGEEICAAESKVNERVSEKEAKGFRCVPK